MRVLIQSVLRWKHSAVAVFIPNLKLLRRERGQFNAAPLSVIEYAQLMIRSHDTLRSGTAQVLLGKCRVGGNHLIEVLESVLVYASEIILSH